MLPSNDGCEPVNCPAAGGTPPMGHTSRRPWCRRWRTPSWPVRLERRPC